MRFPPAEAALEPARDDGYRDRVTVADHRPRPVVPSAPVTAGSEPADMCRLAGGAYNMMVRHNVAALMEGACYGNQDNHLNTYHPPQSFDLRPFWIDRTEVTNAQFMAFLEAARYVPDELHNFLRHWHRGDAPTGEPWRWQIPAAKERHPVVWVDLEDARAYARWADKRLPREEEWHQAAGRGLWPWGDLFDAARCNGDSGDTTAVDRFPAGASPCGCLDMCGNVWEWDRERARRRAYALRHRAGRLPPGGGGQQVVPGQRGAAQRCPRKGAADVSRPRPLRHHRLPLRAR